ncbi:hypothetical protein [Ottowia testudinis]|uniref:Porin n=1 Tax=Ottowia testudinis TaxID=2816950 RepID=A0A975CCN9_9BURK|nr:hypothetical protein [Ottowia testudinis]QTD44018.1 hypothetical protein J1M35_12820 [Ottowia testudinis]
MRAAPRLERTPATALLAVLASTAMSAALAQEGPLNTSLDLSGQLRFSAQSTPAANTGPIAQSNALQPGTASAQPSSAAVQAELRARHALGPVTAQAAATLQGRALAGGTGDASAWVNEATLSAPAAGWKLSVGKKVVSWDVGYAFRPNDVVQQEMRRTLAPVTLIGRPVLLAERFGDDHALALAWVNPLQSRYAPGAAEPALAARAYWRDGPLDWHGFARWGARTGPSLGAAAVWVASDALALHASWRAFAHADRLTNPLAGPRNAALSAHNPWQWAKSGPGQQALVGGTWTSASQISLLLEAWWDGAAPARGDWAAWSARNAALPALLGHGAPNAAVAGNLAWQAQAFGAASSLRRQNLFARLSWQHDRWQPALDMLYMPEDQGRIVTASLAWQGDRVKLEAGWRASFGPALSIARQLPVQRQGFLGVTWAF